MKIRITAKPNEIELMEGALKQIGKITYMSHPYAQTRKSKYNENVAVYIDFELVPVSELDNATKFLKLNVDRTAEVLICDGGLLPFIYKSIGCECFEIVHIGYDYILIVDENGKICEPAKILNSSATSLYPGKLFDYIAGDVLIAKIAMVNGERDIVGLSNDEIAAISMILKAQHFIKGFRQ